MLSTGRARNRLNDLAQRWLWCDDALRPQDVKGLAAASFLHHGSQDIKGLAARAAHETRSTHRTFAAAAGDSAMQAAADYSGSQRDGVFRHTLLAFAWRYSSAAFVARSARARCGRRISNERWSAFLRGEMRKHTCSEMLWRWGMVWRDLMAKVLCGGIYYGNGVVRCMNSENSKC